MKRRLLALPVAPLAAALALSLGALLPALVDDPPPEPIDCPLCAGNVKLHAAMLNFLADSALDQLASSITQPFTDA
ncbi:MAG: hypothetical protein EPO68_15110 [Planctomycetota bacterium]|nr:MAG: hypothetical protein EPO68_15110 [Planctomycetota bacterium]